MRNHRSLHACYFSLAVSLLFPLANDAFAAETADAWQTPAIAGYGKIHALGEHDKTYMPSPHTDAKLLFEITDAIAAPQQVHAALDRVARSINLYVADGVPLDHINCVLMLGRDAVAVALDDQRYRARFGVANPNLDLLHKLSAAGVKIVVSEQALADQQWNEHDLAPQATVALSSLTAVAAMKQNGYSVMPL